jgi:chromosomal replication initiation ATPase DnaA
VEHVKETHIKGGNIGTDIPALRKLSKKRMDVEDIIREADKEFGKGTGLARGVAIYLSHKHTGSMLKDIGAFFGIGGSGVSQAVRRVKQKFENDENLARRIREVEDRINLSIMKN